MCHPHDVPKIRDFQLQVIGHVGTFLGCRWRDGGFVCRRGIHANHAWFRQFDEEIFTFDVAVNFAHLVDLLEAEAQLAKEFSTHFGIADALTTRVIKEIHAT
jgi:hypothetical protein